RTIGARDVEALAALAERLCNPVDVGLGLRQQHAELVAAHPVRRAGRLDRRRELPRETRQQGISGGMAERVVVCLEAVEIEKHEHPRLLLARGLDLRLEVDEEL